MYEYECYVRPLGVFRISVKTYSVSSKKKFVEIYTSIIGVFFFTYQAGMFSPGKVLLKGKAYRANSITADPFMKIFY